MGTKHTIVRSVGMMTDEEGNEFRGAVLEIPEGAPEAELLISVIWDRRPVKLIVLSEDVPA